MATPPPDVTGAVFFGLAALWMAALTRWPRLWIAMSVNRRVMREQFARKERQLRIVTTLGIPLCGIMSLLRYFSP
ncbi:MAG TPA: hypothetical protein VGC56_11695 [Allosphingosinicella sp.]